MGPLIRHDKNATPHDMTSHCSGRRGRRHAASRSRLASCSTGRGMSEVTRAELLGD